MDDAQGLIHLRYWLRQDASYDWNAADPTESAQWPAALRFHDGDDEALFLIDWQARRIALAGSAAEATLTEKMAEGLRIYVSEQFDADPASESAR